MEEVSGLKLYDSMKYKPLQIKGLLDGKAEVTLIDISPRMVPEGYTPEFRCVQSARVSYGNSGLKTPELDAKLLRYLCIHQHTSVLEQCSATFMVKLPIAISTHFVRHRMAKLNMYSMRYAEVEEEKNFYNPLEYEHGIREGTKLNKQSSIDIKDESKKEELKKIIEKANELQYQTHQLYHQMIKQGLAKEIARFYLPVSEYTTMYYQMDLNNLTKMLYLRTADYAQHECCVIAREMMKLVEPFFPITIGILKERINGVNLLESELKVLRKETELSSLVSVSEKEALKEKAKILGIEL